MFEKFRHHHQTLPGVSASDDEHLAALELLLLVAVTDGMLSPDELGAAEQQVESGGWETDTFNYRAMFGPAVAAVRSAMAGDAAEFVEGCAERIASPDLRKALPLACRKVAWSDGASSSDEHEVVHLIERHLR